MTRFFAVLVLLCSGVGPASAARLEPALTAEAREHLKALVRLDTSNPPGNELKAARYLKTKLDKEGISSRVYVSSPTRASLIARIPGSGEKRPLLLMCHTDVVAAERSQWSSDPFTPVEKDGYLYGRGTADIKGMCAAQLSVMLWLKRSRIPLSRDVIFFAEADEENGGPGRHIEWLLDKHGRELEAEFAINEGGNTLWEDGRVSEIRVQASEKEFMDITLIARGESGHSSVPRSGNAVAALARAAARLSEKRFSARTDEVVRGFLERQAPLSGTPLAEAIAEVLGAEPGETLDAAADRLAALHPEFGAMLRDTLTPTMLSAGYKSNVVPGEARAVFNARLLPGTRPEDFLAAVREAVDDPSVEVRAEPPPRPSVPAMPVATELYGAIEEAARKRAPGAPVMPFMAAWTTDSQDLRARGVIVYGLDPPLSEEDGRRVHGVDERIPLAALDWYEEFLRDVVIGVAGK